MSIWEYLEIIRQTPCVSCFNDPGFGYYETIIIRTRNLWSEYKCILPKTISSSRDNIQEMRYNHTGIDTWEIIFGYYETIIRKNTQPIIKYKCIWHRIISSNRDKILDRAKRYRRDHATYHRHKRCQYGNVLRSTDKINVYLVLMILVFGYYETIFWKNAQPMAGI